MDATTPTTRRLDRRDGLILAIATVAAGLVPAVVPAPALPVPLLPTPPYPMPTPAVLAPATTTAVMPAPVMPATPVPPPGGNVSPLPTVVYGTPMPPAGGPDLEVPIMDSASVVSRSTAIATPYLTAWTMALLVIRLRRPHAARRRLTRQPGLAACGVGVAVLAAMVAAGLGRWAAEWLWEAIVPSTPAAAISVAPAPLRPPLTDLYYVARSSFRAGTASIGDAIAATWLIMALGGWWRPEKSGIDRLGRAVGLAWLVLLVASYIDGYIGFG